MRQPAAHTTASGGTREWLVGAATQVLAMAARDAGNDGDTAISMAKEIRQQADPDGWIEKADPANLLDEVLATLLGYRDDRWELGDLAAEVGLAGHEGKARDLLDRIIAAVAARLSARDGNAPF